MMIQHPSYHHVMPPNGITVPSGFDKVIQSHLQRLKLIKYHSLLEIWFGIANQMVLLFYQRSLKRSFMMLWKMYMIMFCIWGHWTRFDRSIHLHLIYFQSSKMMMVLLV